MLVAIVFALAGVQLIRPVDRVTTVFLIDGSDSVSPAQHDRAVSYVEEALRDKAPQDQAAVVVFGQNALVERAPSTTAALGQLASVPVATRTNIQDAIQLGLALLPADTQQRMVLLSDGGENSGRAADAARLAAARNVPLNVVTLTGERGPDVVVTALEAPTTAREGQEINAQVVVRSPFAASGRLQVFVDGSLVVDQNVQVRQGLNTLPIRIPAGQAGFRRLEARLDVAGDTQSQNNRAAAFTQVEGPPRMLLIASDPATAQNLQDALVAVGVRPDVRQPGQVSASLAELGDYAAVILVDTPARDLPRPLMEALPVYVRDLGRGLAMIGGVDSFGAGGYRRTPIEEALPVNLDPLDTTQQPNLALAMVIDRSGSMDEPTAGGRTKLDLAKEAVYQASLALSQQDQIDLTVFDDHATTILPLQPLPSAINLEQALSSFNSGGGTDIRPGIEQAAQALASADAKIKHVILLTDGNAPSNYSDLVQQMRADNITISTVAIGSDANANLEQIAKLGGGRWYHVEQANDVPRIFLHETVIVAGRDIVEEQFTPQVALQTAAIRNLGGLPPLEGYNGTEIKQAARNLLVTPDGKPVLAQWQYGLGRTVAWTSDMEGKWGKNWVQWNQFPQFISGLVDLLQPLHVDDQLSIQATTSGAQTSLELNAQDASGKPLNNLTLEGRLVGPNNDGRTLSFTQIDVGRYRAIVDTADPGVYLAQVAASAQGIPLGTASSGVVVSYSPEYSDNRENPQLLRDLAALTNGQVDAPAAAAFTPTKQNIGSVQELALPLLWLALLLWPFDIAVRRVFLRPSEFLPRLAQFRRPRPAATPAETTATMARLASAKRRATAERSAPTPQPARAAEQNTAAPAASPTEASVPSAQPVARTHAMPARKEPAPAVTSDDQFARLLAAKRRARSARDDES
jgi:Mg-chelatase subunit ChlD